MYRIVFEMYVGPQRRGEPALGAGAAGVTEAAALFSRLLALLSAVGLAGAGVVPGYMVLMVVKPLSS